MWPCTFPCKAGLLLVKHPIVNNNAGEHSGSFVPRAVFWIPLGKSRWGRCSWRPSCICHITLFRDLFSKLQKKCTCDQHNWSFIFSIHVHLFFGIPKPASSFFFLQVPETHPLFYPLLLMSSATVLLKHSPSLPASWNCPSMCNPSDLYFFRKHIA